MGRWSGYAQWDRSLQPPRWPWLPWALVALAIGLALAVALILGRS